MASALKYMVDEKGEKTSVIIPVKTWNKLNSDYTRLQNKLNVLAGIKNGFAEATASKKNEKKLQTLKDFLHKSNC